MQAVVLVGGFGTRLRPLTLTTPKQMLPVAGRPMIEHVIANLVQHGVRTVILALGYRDDVFTSAYPDGACAGAELVCAVEPEPLGTAGAIRFAWEFAGATNETFVAVNGDVISGVDLSALVQDHRRHNAEATIHLVPVDDPSRYGVVLTDDEGRVGDFVEKPPGNDAPSRWVNAGTYVLEPSVMDLVAPDRSVSVERQVFPALAERGALWAAKQDVYWVDAGTAETYLQVQRDFLEGRHPAPPGSALADSDAPDQRETVAQRGFIAPDALVAPDAVVSHSVVRSSAVVRRHAELRRSVAMTGARIGVGARLVDSVVLERAEVGAYCRISGSVIGPGASVGPGSELTGGCLLGAETHVEAGTTLNGARIPDPNTGPPARTTR